MMLAQQPVIRRRVLHDFRIEQIVIHGGHRVLQESSAKSV
jgi:hypothetical protein